MPASTAPAAAGTPPPSIGLDAQAPMRLAEQSYDWMAAHWLSISLSLAAGIIIFLVLLALRGAARRAWERDASPSNLAGLLARAVTRTTRLFMALAAARLVVGYANPPSWLFDTVRFLFTIATVLQVAIWLRELIFGVIERKAAPDQGYQTLSNAVGIIRLLVSITLFSIAAIIVLDNVGVNVTGLVAGLGIGGIAIGLAAQGIFSDLFAALAIIFDRPFQVGDTITYDNTTAVVEHIGLKSTRLRAMTGERKIIANTQLLSKEITNLADLSYRRLIYKIGLVYQTAPAVALRVPALLKEVAEQEGGTFVRCGFTGFGASSLDYELAVDIRPTDWDHVFAMRHAIGVAILSRFNAEGIAFAYPTQTTFTAGPDGEMILPYASDGVMLKVK